MDKAAILSAVRREFPKHCWDTFIDEPPSIAQGGRGVVVPGCPACRKKINTITEFVDHLTDDVMPKILEDLLRRRLAAPWPGSFPSLGVSDGI